MTVLWFVTWLIANNVGGPEPLTINPVNAWAATLILAVGLTSPGQAGCPSALDSPFVTFVRPFACMLMMR